MKKISGLLSLFVLSIAVQGATMEPASGLLLIGESVTNFTLQPVEGSKLSRLNVDVASSDWAISGNAVVNPDPFIDYGFTIKNLGSADLNFLFMLSTPYIGGAYTIGKSSHSGSVTDSSGKAPANGSVTVTPAALGIHQPFVDGNAFGAIVGGCNESGVAGDSFPCGWQNRNGLPILTNVAGTLSIVLQGTLSGGDVYTFNGLASISGLQSDEVPEPATAGMAVIALGLAFAVRKRLAA